MLFSSRGVPVLLAIVVFASSCRGEAPPPASGGGSGTIVESSAEKLTAAIRRLRPDPVVANYWATWCDPCKKEMPRVVAAASRYKGRVAFVGVNVEDDLASARSFARQYGVTFRSYAVSRAEVQRTQDILGLPVTQFYGADGELAFVHQGEITADDLENRIQELLRVGVPAEEG